MPELGLKVRSTDGPMLLILLPSSVLPPNPCLCWDEHTRVCVCWATLDQHTMLPFLNLINHHPQSSSSDCENVTNGKCQVVELIRVGG